MDLDLDEIEQMVARWEADAVEAAEAGRPPSEDERAEMAAAAALAARRTIDQVAPDSDGVAAELTDRLVGLSVVVAAAWTTMARIARNPAAIPVGGIGEDTLARLVLDQGREILRRQIVNAHAYARMAALTNAVVARNQADLGSNQTGYVVVSDALGRDTDAECIDANGQVWTVVEASNRVIEHPNCTRQFADATPPAAVGAI